MFVFLTHPHTNCVAYPQTNVGNRSHTNSYAYPTHANICAFSWSDVRAGLSTSPRFVDTLATTGPTEQIYRGLALHFDARWCHYG